MRVGLVVVAAIVGGSAGCPSRSGDANDLAVSSDQDARAVAQRLMLDLAAGDGDAAVARFCDQRPEARALARAVISPGLSRPDLQVQRVEPAWVGATPYFYVELSAPSLRDGAPSLRDGAPSLRDGAPSLRDGAPSLRDGAPAPGWVHGFGVDVRSGCLERAVGEAALGEAAAVGEAAVGGEAAVVGEGGADSENDVVDTSGASP